MPRPSARDRLLAAGLDRIHRNGFAATGVADIAEAAGAPKGSFYNHFPSKEAFGIAALEAYRAASAHAFAALADPALPPARRVRTHFARLRDLIAGKHFVAGCLMGNLAGEGAAVSEPIRLRLRELFAEWSAGLAACMHAGAATADGLTPEQLADVLIAAWQGAVQRAKVERDGAPLDAFAMLLERLLPG
jgi:TetR/AcrR family transcriptional repressor of nem operon